MEPCMLGTSIQYKRCFSLIRLLTCVMCCQVAMSLSVRFLLQIACWNSHIGPITALKWAPRRAMFATASTALTFWITNQSNQNQVPGKRRDEISYMLTYQMFISCSFVQKIDVMYEITYFITICGNNDIVPGRYLLQRSLSYLYIYVLLIHLPVKLL